LDGSVCSVEQETDNYFSLLELRIALCELLFRDGIFTAFVSRYPQRWEYRVDAVERCSCNPSHKGAVRVLDYPQDVVIHVDFNDVGALWSQVGACLEAFGCQLVVTSLGFQIARSLAFRRVRVFIAYVGIPLLSRNHVDGFGSLPFWLRFIGG
jgi:hypothetical protein